MATVGALPASVGPARELTGDGVRRRGSRRLGIGQDNSTPPLLGRNFWGPGWDTGGYFTLAHAYLIDSGQSQDMRTSHTVR